MKLRDDRTGRYRSVSADIAVALEDERIAVRFERGELVARVFPCQEARCHLESPRWRRAA